ncbi:hypothetical protein N0V82_006519 [Gnomoniopsis sp. IMI 355080]|nr:hypothetical protein N0V82_006519 [Gnomoniopsis sp. IMI 355080]
MASHLTRILGKHIQVVVAGTLEDGIIASSVDSLQGYEGLVGILASAITKETGPGFTMAAQRNCVAATRHKLAFFWVTDVDAVPCKKVSVPRPQGEDTEQSTAKTIEGTPEAKVEQPDAEAEGDEPVELVTELAYPEGKKAQKVLIEYHKRFVERGRVVIMPDGYSQETLAAAINTLREKWNTPRYTTPPTYKESATQDMTSTCANKPITLEAAPAEVWTKLLNVEDGTAAAKSNEYYSILAKDSRATRKVRGATERGDKAQNMTITDESWVIVVGCSGDNINALKEMIPGLEIRRQSERRLDIETQTMRSVLSVTAPNQQDLDLAIKLIESVDATRFKMFISKAHIGEVCRAVKALTSCHKVDYGRKTGIWTLVGVAEARTRAEAAVRHWKEHKAMPDTDKAAPQYEFQRQC